LTWLAFLLVGAASGLVFPLVFRAAQQWRVRAAELGAVLGVVTGALVWLQGVHDSATVAMALWASLSFAMVGGWVLTETGTWQAGASLELAGEAGVAGGAAGGATGPVGEAEPRTRVDQRQQPEQAGSEDAPRHGEPPEGTEGS
jgi:hypothetical protein